VSAHPSLKKKKKKKKVKKEEDEEERETSTHPNASRNTAHSSFKK
jgi:hypothetical protein